MGWLRISVNAKLLCLSSSLSLSSSCTIDNYMQTASCLDLIGQFLLFSTTNKTKWNLEVERSPKLARIRFAVSHWSLCNDISDIDSYKLLPSGIASFRSTLVHVRFVSHTVPPIQLLQLVTRQDSLCSCLWKCALDIAPPTLFIQVT